MHESRDERAKGLDPPGVVAVTLGLLALVFGIIEAGRYGWWKPIGDQSIGGWNWPLARDLDRAGRRSLLAVVVPRGRSSCIEMRRVAAGKPVVFDFTDLVHQGFRYGLINTTVLAMGEFGAFFVLPIFLQAGLHLSAIQTGTWLLPGRDHGVRRRRHRRSAQPPLRAEVRHHRSASRSRRSASGCTSSRSRTSTTFLDAAARR